jgi:hypothetical protein
MMQSIGRRFGSGRVIFMRVMMLVAISVIAGSLTTCLADDPKPDPTGIMTGDKTTAVDAGGNSFVGRSQPTKRTRITPPRRMHSMSTRPRQRKNHWP